MLVNFLVAAQVPCADNCSQLPLEIRLIAFQCLACQTSGISVQDFIAKNSKMYVRRLYRHLIVFHPRGTQKGFTHCEKNGRLMLKEDKIRLGKSKGSL